MQYPEIATQWKVENSPSAPLVLIATILCNRLMAVCPQDAASLGVKHHIQEALQCILLRTSNQPEV
jgi:hypothetical protein